MNGRARTHGPAMTTAVAVLAGSMLVPGFWAWLAPASFAEAVDFPFQEHFLHDAGVFQIGIGAGLLGALFCSDALVVVLAGFLTANTLHAVNHAADLPLGGHPQDAVGLGALSVLAAVALCVRARQLAHPSDRSVS